MKSKLVKTLERTRRSFSLRSGLLSSITKCSIEVMLCAVVLDWVEAPRDLQITHRSSLRSIEEKSLSSIELGDITG
jgi:hypothetical protein